MSKIAATDRLARLVAAIPWIVAQDGAHVDEIAERFDYPREMLLDDLHNVVFFVGVPPYTPDTLIEVQIDDDIVWINYADWFSRPMRLTGGEALALLAAGESVLAVSGGDEVDSLARGLAKLRLTTGAGAETLDVQLGVAPESVLQDLRHAQQAGLAVDISYYSFARNERTARRIEPQRFFAEDGHWYVVAFCHLAEGERVFRLDRIDNLTITDAAATSSVPPSDDHFALDDQPRATIRLPLSRMGLLEHVPHDDLVHSKTEDSADSADSLVEVTLPISSIRWLERLAVRIGPRAELVRADDRLGEISFTAAAARLADLYR